MVYEASLKVISGSESYAFLSGGTECDLDAAFASLRHLTGYRRVQSGDRPFSARFDNHFLRPATTLVQHDPHRIDHPTSQSGDRTCTRCLLHLVELGSVRPINPGQRHAYSSGRQPMDRMSCRPPTLRCRRAGRLGARYVRDLNSETTLSSIRETRCADAASIALTSMKISSPVQCSLITGKASLISSMAPSTA
jgi:hypothetical protein